MRLAGIRICRSDATRGVKLMEADMQSYRTRHQQVIVTAGYRTERSVLPPFV